MRWRIAIGVLAVLGIAGAVYFSTQPRKGTVEWHKRKYLQAGVPGWALLKGVPGVVRHFYERRFLREYELHQRALIEAGYLREKVFVVSNASVINTMKEVQIELPKNISEFTSMAWRVPDTNAITVVAPRDWVEKIGEAIREADVPLIE